MNNIVRKVAIVLLFITIIVFTTLIYCNSMMNKKTIEYLKQKSITLSLATYTGTETIILNNSVDEAKERLLNRMVKCIDDNIKVKDIDINSYYKKNSVLCFTVSIEEIPFKTAVFYVFTYKIIDGKWKIINFNLDS